MDYDLILRAGAVLAGAAGLAGPSLVAAVKKIPVPSIRPAKDEEKADPLADAHTILEIAKRLKTAGCEKGVALCQQLIDVMLSPEKKA